MNVKTQPARAKNGSTAKPPKRGRDWRATLSRPIVKIGLAAFLIACTIGLGIFAFFYIKYERIVDHRMRGQIFSNAAKIYARPSILHPGDKFDGREITAELHRAGYSEDQPDDQKIGTYRLIQHGIEVRPGANSYHSPEGAVISASNGKVERISSVDDGRELDAYELEPPLLTALFEGEQRSKRRLVRYEDIPKVMIDAVLAIEDRRFFQHSGVNYYRIAEAAWVNFRAGKYEQGGSTLTMQIARGFFLTPEKNYKRKLTEILISMILEQKFSKKQIFELYANQIYMGQRGSFTLSGFGEASQAYFGKDLKNLTLPEAALLVGIIQRPSYYDPYRHPERVLERRNLVLDGMVETGAITQEQADRAKATPLKLASPNVEASEAPYFVDLVRDTLIAKYNEKDVNENAYRIYTTLDTNLQKAAAEAIEVGMKEVDAQVKKLRTHTVVKGKGKAATKEKVISPGPEAQVALVALDPHTGEVLALVGGRNYGTSQLNHAVAKRPTGSIFKPFVYAAAVNTGINGADTVLTPASMVDDSPTTFTYGDQIYEPRNYKEEYHGPVTARYALAMSLNNATVKLAEQVGYDKVAQLARAAGIKSVQPTPAMALGSYDATPLDMAGAYTVFANSGTRLQPLMISSLRDARGNVIENFSTKREQVLDPRVAYVMTDMMQGVLNFGTAAGVRSRGFTSPAAGKTGTSHDAWFAGYTSNLLCIVWVGYDDYSDLRLSGAYTAAPIWAEFMKRAVTLPGYTDPQPFPAPAGVTGVKLDKITNRLATPTCPDDYYATFISGTEPRDFCDQSGTGAISGFFSKIFGGESKPSPPPAVSNGAVSSPPGAVAEAAPGSQDQTKKKKGFWGRLFGGGGDDKDKKGDKATSPAVQPAPGSQADPVQPRN
ncbi:MAG TPA: PBP1A family penicillin-binding protein [Terriglobales bacterium]|nr:PBP1A family penicillin-binding protein [Terriglobales bacterium]